MSKIAETLDRRVETAEGGTWRCIGCGEWPPVVIRSNFIQGAAICPGCIGKSARILKTNAKKLSPGDRRRALSRLSRASRAGRGKT